MQFNKYTHTHTQVSLIPPWEDQREWHRMTRMTRPDCAVMCNLINTHTHTSSGGGGGEMGGGGILKCRSTTQRCHFRSRFDDRVSILKSLDDTSQPAITTELDDSTSRGGVSRKRRTAPLISITSTPWWYRHSSYLTAPSDSLVCSHRGRHLYPSLLLREIFVFSFD